MERYISAEYINSRKRLVHKFSVLWGGEWCLQYWVKTWFGYNWVTVARCDSEPGLTVNGIIEYLEDLRVCDKVRNRG